MAEFEISTRFSLRSVILARLCILAAADFILICLLVPLVFIHSGVTFVQTGIYILCPYLLTAYLELRIVRKIHSKEATYLCVGVSAGISVGMILLYQTCLLSYAEHNFIWWICAFVLLGLGTIKQCCQMIKQTEELVWNL